MKFSKYVAASNFNGKKMIFKDHLKVRMARYTLRELLTDMNHYENLTDGKTKDSEIQSFLMSPWRH